MKEDDYEYLLTAVQTAMKSLFSLLEREGVGTLQSWEVRQSELGWLLSVVIASQRHGGALVLNRRLILPASGPNLDPETAGTIYTSNLIERLLTARVDEQVTSLSEPTDLAELRRVPKRP